ncbi:leucyl aminopeptidase [Candidatus Halobeggiatoa sp. HSG11]|nr:leucyl aminopeptidase [Candidatus Halobeggiatoa sp. HSG11]
MEFNVKSGLPEKQRTACIIVGVHENYKLSDTAKKIDDISKGYLSSILQSGDLKDKLGQTLLLYKVPGINAERVLLVNCGNDIDDNQYRKIITSSVNALLKTRIKEAICHLTYLEIANRDIAWKIKQVVEITQATAYFFNQFKTKPDDHSLNKMLFGISSNRDIAKRACLDAQKIADGIKLAKDLGNLPSNICNPSYLANQAKNLAKLHIKLTCKVLDKAAIKKEGMNTLLAVGQGSNEPPKLITLEYNNGGKAAPVVLVGKGVTFDSGGISIKPSKDMDEMKYDMCGAASVLGVLSVVAELQLPINVIGIIPSVENMPSGTATKPGDIVTSLSGQTVEILNTDAEGRLILCDALTYAERYKPDVVIDIATLTGACVIALGGHAIGLLGNNDSLIQDLLEAGELSGDRAWQLPLWDDYQKQLDSPFADMANIGGREGGTITAACFLSRFTEKYKWAHLDIAGTAWISGKKKGATGRSVSLLVQYLMEYCVK